MPINIRSRRGYIIAPMGAGKTTLAKRHPDVRDDDDAVDPARENELKELRRHAILTDDWMPHNDVWHKMLQRWVATLPTDVIITAHSFHDARVLGADDSNTAVVLIDPREQRRRLKGRGADAEALKLSELNWRVVIDDAVSRRLPIFGNIEAAYLHFK